MISYEKKMHALEEQSNQLILIKIENELKKTDKKLFKKFTRKKHVIGYGYRYKKIITPFGVIPLKRHRLLNKKEHKFSFPLDEYLGLSGHQRFDINFVHKIRELIDDNCYLNYRQLVQSQPYKTCKSQIHYLIKNLIQHQPQSYNYQMSKSSPLYVNVDDMFLHLMVNKRLIKEQSSIGLDSIPCIRVKMKRTKS